ncbi:MAG: DNA polymerase/3'-5' exonuclease PolX [Verrucomicrobiota bacterium]
MAVEKDLVIQVLNEIAVLLDLKGENPFKGRAYSVAARALDLSTEPWDKLIAPERLAEVDGVGEAIAKKVQELVTTGKLRYYEELKASVPPGLIDMLRIPGLGPKKIKVLHEKLGITTVDELEQACTAGRVAHLAGFGEKTQANICAGIQRRRSYADRHLLLHAWLLAEPILEALRSHPDVVRASTAGSLRRCREVVGDLDFLISSRRPGAVIDYFTSLPGILSVQAKGETKASVVLEGGVQADLRVVSDIEFPFALLYFTGSKEHNIVMRQRSIERGLRLNEYGLFRSSEETRDPKLRLNCRSEEEVFSELGLAYIPPELREDMGEFAVAARGETPRLIEWSDLKGSLHNHSTWSDGNHTLDEIVAHMRELGCSYWAITDHSKTSWQANGLEIERLQQQLAEIRAINRRLEDEGAEFQLLTGAEVDILVACQLDFADEVLAQLDVVVASVHQSFTQSEAEMTKRLIAAAQNRYVHILGHPTGRLLLEREPCKVNLPAVIDACAETGTWIELNCSPYRFDMDWRFWPLARSKGVKCVINPDAHRNEHAGYLRLGASIARKGGLTREDVINTLPLPALLTALQQKRSRA